MATCSIASSCAEKSSGRSMLRCVSAPLRFSASPSIVSVLWPRSMLPSSTERTDLFAQSIFAISSPPWSPTLLPRTSRKRSLLFAIKASESTVIPASPIELYARFSRVIFGLARSSPASAWQPLSVMSFQLRSIVRTCPKLYCAKTATSASTSGSPMRAWKFSWEFPLIITSVSAGPPPAAVSSISMSPLLGSQPLFVHASWYACLNDFS
mmetsp:Transcript_30248/g.71956  ORF Transcript_30248/g.71956 Transcript_30248/m.71956 type:complete len:210 (-) Transcript_30248:61-690(-)